MVRRQQAADKPSDDWCAFPDEDAWMRVARTERGGYPPEGRYQIRRARRLNAYFATRG